MSGHSDGVIDRAFDSSKLDCDGGTYSNICSSDDEESVDGDNNTDGTDDSEVLECVRTVDCRGVRNNCTGDYKICGNRTNKFSEICDQNNRDDLHVEGTNEGSAIELPRSPVDYTDGDFSGSSSASADDCDAIDDNRSVSPGPISEVTANSKRCRRPVDIRSVLVPRKSLRSILGNVKKISLHTSGLWEKLKNNYGWEMHVNAPVVLGSFPGKFDAYIHPDIVKKGLFRAEFRNQLEYNVHYFFSEDLVAYVQQIGLVEVLGEYTYVLDGVTYGPPVPAIPTCSQTSATSNRAKNGANSTAHEGKTKRIRPTESSVVNHGTAGLVSKDAPSNQLEVKLRKRPMDSSTVEEEVTLQQNVAPVTTSNSKVNIIQRDRVDGRPNREVCPPRSLEVSLNSGRTYDVVGTNSRFIKDLLIEKSGLRRELEMKHKWLLATDGLKVLGPLALAQVFVRPEAIPTWEDIRAGNMIARQKLIKNVDYFFYSENTLPRILQERGYLTVHDNTRRGAEAFTLHFPESPNPDLADSVQIETNSNHLSDASAIAKTKPRSQSDYSQLLRLMRELKTRHGWLIKMNGRQVLSNHPCPHSKVYVNVNAVIKWKAAEAGDVDAKNNLQENEDYFFATKQSLTNTNPLIQYLQTQGYLDIDFQTVKAQAKCSLLYPTCNNEGVPTTESSPSSRQLQSDHSSQNEESSISKCWNWNTFLSSEQTALGRIFPSVSEENLVQLGKVFLRLSTRTPTTQTEYQVNNEGDKASEEVTILFSAMMMFFENKPLPQGNLLWADFCVQLVQMWIDLGDAAKEVFVIKAREKRSILASDAVSKTEFTITLLAQEARADSNLTEVEFDSFETSELDGVCQAHLPERNCGTNVYQHQQLPAPISAIVKNGSKRKLPILEDNQQPNARKVRDKSLTVLELYEGVHTDVIANDSSTILSTDSAISSGKSVLCSDNCSSVTSNCSTGESKDAATSLAGISSTHTAEASAKSIEVLSENKDMDELKAKYDADLNYCQDEYRTTGVISYKIKKKMAEYFRHLKDCRGWEWRSVSAKSGRANPYDSAYFSRWCPGLDDGNKFSYSGSLENLVENCDYFWLLDDVYEYLLQFGDTNAREQVTIKEKQRLAHIVRSGGSSVSTTNARAPVIKTRNSHQHTNTEITAIEKWESRGFIRFSDIPLISNAQSIESLMSPASQLFANALVRRFVRVAGPNRDHWRAVDGKCIVALVNTADRNNYRWGVVFEDSTTGELNGTEMLAAVFDRAANATAPAAVGSDSVSESDISQGDLAPAVDSQEETETLRLGIKEAEDKLAMEKEHLSKKVVEVEELKHREAALKIQLANEKTKFEVLNIEIHKKDRVIKCKDFEIASLREKLAQLEKSTRDELRDMKDGRDAAVRHEVEKVRRRFLQSQRQIAVSTHNNVNSSNKKSITALAHAPVDANKFSKAVQGWLDWRDGFAACAQTEKVDWVGKQKTAIVETNIEPDVEVVKISQDNAEVIEFFTELLGKRKTPEKMKMKLQVIRKRQVAQQPRLSASSSSSSDVIGRVKVVETGALDLGGILTELMDSFMVALLNHVVGVDQLLPSRVSSGEATDDAGQAKFPLFSCTNNAIHFLPSRLAISGPEIRLGVLEFIPLSLNAVVPDKRADVQRKSLLTIYEALGKAMNQSLRENLMIPESFSSPLLLIFLLHDFRNGVEEALLWANLSLSDWIQMVEEVDYETFGMPEAPAQRLIQEIKDRFNDEDSDSEQVAIRALVVEVVIPLVIRPRQGPLDAIKRGFDSVPLSKLRDLTLAEIRTHLVGRLAVGSQDLQQAARFNSVHECCDQFEKVVRGALNLLQPEERNKLLKFATGCEYYNETVAIQIWCSRFVQANDRRLAWPEHPLATALTCCNHLYICMPWNEQAARPEQVFTPENVRDNLIIAIENAAKDGGEFSDKAAIVE